MYLTSMSVFLSSSAIISRWNLLNFRRGGVGVGGVRGSKRREHTQVIRAQTQDGARRAIVVNVRWEGERPPPGERSLGLYRCTPAGASAESELCAYEWVRDKAWERLLCSPSCSRSLEPEWARRWLSPQPCRGTISVSSTGQTDSLRESVRLRRQCLVSDALTGLRRRSSCIASRPDETPWLIRSGSFTYQPTQWCCFSVTVAARCLQLLLQTHIPACSIQENYDF